MNESKYIGLDVHQATISVAVLGATGSLVMEAILETKTETILQFLRGLRGGLQVTLEEGTWAAWLHDLLKPHVTRVVVCDTRKAGLGKNTHWRSIGVRAFVAAVVHMKLRYKQSSSSRSFESCKILAFSVSPTRIMM